MQTPIKPISEACERLKKYLASLPSGKVTSPEEAASLLSACWDELDGDTRGIMPFQVPAFVEQLEWKSPKLMFVIKPRTGVRVNGETWTLNTNLGTLTTPSDADFEKLLETKEAKELIADKLDPLLLKCWLRIIAETPLRRFDNQERRHKRANALAKKCRDLDAVIRAEDPPRYGPAEYEQWERVRRELIAFAPMWERIHTRRPGDPKITDPRQAVIANFIHTVEEITGSQHYREIASLLNAINDIPRYHLAKSVPYNERMLENRMRREREKLDALIT